MSEKSLEYLQGDGVYDSGMMAFLTGLKDSIWTHFDLFIADAQALAAIFMIIFFAIKSYEMISGDSDLEGHALIAALWFGDDHFLVGCVC